MSNIGANLTADKKVTPGSMFEWVFIPSLLSMVIFSQLWLCGFGWYV